METNNSKENEIVDVESYAREGKEIPPGRQYMILIDRQNYTVKQECMTGREILTLAGKAPVERFQLNVRIHGGKVEKVGYDQDICFTKPGIEKFMTIPLDQTEGNEKGF
jgi:hypothetical protein